MRLVVPFPPGGAVDNAARIIAARLSEMWGQQMVIENKGGAGGNIAAQAVLAADADGYTVYICSIGHAINQFIYRSLGYDPVADFAPVTLMCVYPNILAVPNSSPDHVGAGLHRARQGRSRQDDLLRPPASALRCIWPASCSSAWPASTSRTFPIAAPGRR